MALFGDLVATVADRERSNLRTQVCQSMVPLLLHLKDQCPAVVTVSANRQAFRLGKGTGWPGQATLGAPQITDPSHTLPYSAPPDLWVCQRRQCVAGSGQTVYLLVHGSSLPYHAPLSGVPDIREGTTAASFPDKLRRSWVSPCLPQGTVTLGWEQLPRHQHSRLQSWGVDPAPGWGGGSVTHTGGG